MKLKFTLEKKKRNQAEYLRIIQEEGGKGRNMKENVAKVKNHQGGLFVNFFLSMKWQQPLLLN